MAITFKEEYPSALKNAAWQKNKSFKDKAKAKTKTGLGEALTTAEKAWGKIKFENLIAAKQNLAGKKLFEMEAANKKARAYLDGPVVKTAITSLEAASRKADETGKNAYLSATATKAAKALSGGLQRQALLLHDIKLNDFNAEMAGSEQSVNRWQNQHEEALHSMDTVRDDLSSSKDKETWQASNVGTIIENTIKITKSLADETGDKNWIATHDSWRRLMILYATSDKRVKSGPSSQVAEEIDSFTDLIQANLGHIYH